MAARGGGAGWGEADTKKRKKEKFFPWELAPSYTQGSHGPKMRTGPGLVANMQDAGHTFKPLLEVASGDSVVGIRKLRPESALDKQAAVRLRKIIGDSAAGTEATGPKHDRSVSKKELAGLKNDAVAPKKEVVKKESVAKAKLSQYAQNGEALVNKQFFDANANVGVMDNCSWKERDTIQCPFNPAHRFGTRKEDHIDQCTRASGYGKKLPQCNYNRFHRLFPHQEADHYRFCATFLMQKARYRFNFPSMSDFFLVTLGMPPEDKANWTYEKYLAYCKERLEKPNIYNGEKNFDWFERNVTSRHFFMGDDIMEPLCKVVIAEGKKLREEEARNPLPVVPNFYNRRRPRLLMPIQPVVEKDPEFAHLSVKPMKKTPEYVRPPRDTWDEDEFFRTEVDYKAPVRQRFLSELGWAFFDLLVERNRIEEETGVKQPRPDPDKFMMEVWLPKLIKEKEEAARGQTGQDSQSVK